MIQTQRFIRSFGATATTADSFTKPLQQCLDAVAHVISEGVRGDLVEIGVYKGVMMMAACAKLMQLGIADRVVHLYDTFEGMTKPTADDVLIRTGAAPNLSNPNVLVRSPLHEVKRNMSLVGYPEGQLRFHVGDICLTQTFQRRLPFCV